MQTHKLSHMSGPYGTWNFVCMHVSTVYLKESNIRTILESVKLASYEPTIQLHN